MKKVSKIAIAKNYAQALFDAAADKNLLKETFQDCKKLAENFNVSELKALNNPAWQTQDKNEVMKQIAKTLELSQPSANFLTLLAQNRRLDVLKAALEQFKHIYYKENGVCEINVESVQKLTSEQEKRLQQNLEKILEQKIVVNYNINPDILGGLVVQYGSVRIDDSLSGKLNRLEQIMKGKA